MSADLAGRAPIVVVGASIAGLTVAQSLRAEGCTAPIHLIGDEVHLPYGRPPLSKQVLAGQWPEERALLGGVEALVGDRIALHTGSAATALDLPGRRVAHGGRWQEFSELVVATGLRARRLDTAGGAVPGLRTLDDVRALRPALASARRVVVVGGGVLGQEFAAVAAGAGVEVTVVQNLPSLALGSLGPLLSERLLDLHGRHGVQIRLGAAVTAADRTPEGGWRVDLADGSMLEADLVVACLGGIPNTEWLAGNALDLTDGVRCDADGLAAPGVHAVGDVAAWFDPVLGRHRRLEHQTSAIEQAMAVARRIVHGPGASAAPSTPYFWSDQYDVKIQAFGSFDPPGEFEDIDCPTGELLAWYRDGRCTGVVGWNAGRAFRAARALVGSPELVA